MKRLPLVALILSLGGCPADPSSSSGVESGAGSGAGSGAESGASTSPGQETSPTGDGGQDECNSSTQCPGGVCAEFVCRNGNTSDCGHRVCIAECFDAFSQDLSVLCVDDASCCGDFCEDGGCAHGHPDPDDGPALTSTGGDTTTTADTTAGTDSSGTATAGSGDTTSSSASSTTAG